MTQRPEASAAGQANARRRPGPSETRRAAKARRDDLLRRIWSTSFSDVPSAHAASILIARRIRVYAPRFRRDLECGIAPDAEPERSFFYALAADRELSERSIRRILEQRRSLIAKNI